MYLKVLRLVQIQWTSPFFNLRTMLSLWVNGLSTMKKNLYHILRCFHMASDLKVNFAKSKFFGLASLILILTLLLPHIVANHLPFLHLTSWKAKNLSIGGSLTLIKSVLGSLGTYFFSLLKAPWVVIKYLEKLRRNFFWGGDMESNKMAWLSWKKICSPSTCGGLGVGSLQAMNLAMLTKFVWSGGFGSTGATRQPLSPWWPILNLKISLSSVGMNLNLLFTRKVGAGSSIAFWHDNWIRPSNLKSLYPRLFTLKTNKECRISDLCFTQNGLPHHILAWRSIVRDGHEMNQLRDLLGLVNSFCPCDTPDSWAFTLNTHKYIIVASMRREIEKHILCDQPNITRWNKSLPIKINVHMWHLYLDRLPTRCNFYSRSIDLHSSRCPIRDGDIKTAQHLFIDCLIASGLWHMVIKWWNLENHLQDLHSLLSWSDTINFMDTAKTCFDVVVHTTTWIIWRYRNHVCFDSKPRRIGVIEPNYVHLGWVTGEKAPLGCPWTDPMFMDFLQDLNNVNGQDMGKYCWVWSLQELDFKRSYSCGTKSKICFMRHKEELSEVGLEGHFPIV
ncbi:RNA-directed DNA polymerase, eukaryota, reverse transcriptase zinc-binding domain protein [Tanacetum coccineum]